MTFKNLLIAVVLIGLFSLALISFAFQSQIDNGVNTLINDPTMNYTNYSLYRTLNSASNTSQTNLNATNTDDVTMGVGGLLYLSIVGVLRTFTSTISSTYNIISSVMLDQFRIPPIVLTTLMTLLLILVVFLMWRNIRTGD